MNKKQFTAMILSRGWSVKDALARWERTYDWYHRQVNGSDAMQKRLIDMINGLPISS